MLRTASLVAIFCFMFATAAGATPPERTITVAERSSINLTVYNGGTALIHDRRRVYLESGANRIAWRDVSANMDATSALLDSSGGNVSVVEQNFDFDLFNPSALLNRYIGRDVIVVHDPRFVGDPETREVARVLSTNDGIVLRYRDRIETELRGHIAFPVSSSNFRDRPTLVLDLASGNAGTHTLDLSYLTGGLSWRADYVGLLNADATNLSLNGLVTLSNTSGTSYEDARLQLVAGTVNVAQAAGQLRTIAHVTADSYSGGQFGQENYFEYHLYTLSRPTTVLDQQTKQISLLSAHEVPVHKTLELRGTADYYRSAEPDIGDRLPIGVYVTFQNRGGELGIPLPAGIVRLYQNDSHGTSQFLGSDGIAHTSKNESVRLHLGDSFDLTARKRQTDFQVNGACTTVSAYEVRLSNAKAVSQNVLVVEPIPGSWQILAENYPHVKSSASTASWSVNVPADGSATLTYTARTKWC